MADLYVIEPESSLVWVLKKAAKSSPPVIAIGKKGGKIIGYDAHHKPIYLDESKSAAASMEEEKAAIPVALKSWLGSLLIGINDPGIRIEPHGGKPDVWSIAWDPDDPNVSYVDAGSKSGVDADKYGIKWSKNRVKLKDGFIKGWIKLPPGKPVLPTMEEPSSSDVQPLQGDSEVVTAPKGYNKKPPLKAYDGDLPTPGHEISALDASKILGAGSKWKVVWSSKQGKLTTKPIQIKKWISTGKHAPKGLPPASLGWPGSWDADQFSLLLSDDKSALTVMSLAPGGVETFSFIPADKTGKALAEMASLGGPPPGSSKAPSPAASLDDNFETMPDVETTSSGPSKSSFSKVTYDVVANLGGTNGAKHLVSSQGKHLVWKPADPFAGPAEVGSSELANYITSGLVPEATPMAYQGKPGVVQNMVTLAKHPGGGFDPKKLNPDQAAQLFAHMVSDWVTSNYDAHSGNFGIDPGGNVIGIDKGQSYKFFDSEKVSSFSNLPGGEPKSFDTFYTKGWPPIPPDKPVYPAFIKGLKDGSIQLDPNHPVVVSAILKASQMSMSHLDGLSKYATKAFKSSAYKFKSAIVDRASKVKAEAAKLFSDLGISQEPKKFDPTVNSLIPKPESLPTKVKIGAEHKAGGKVINDPRDAWLNGTVTLGGKSWKVIGRQRSSSGDTYSSAPLTSEKWLVRSGKTTKMVSADSLEAAGVKPFEGNPLYGDLPESAAVVKASPETKKMMDSILGGMHKNGQSYADVIELYQENGVGVAVAGGILRDVLQGVKGKDVDVVVTCSAHTSAKIALSSKGWISDLKYSSYGGKRTGQKFSPQQSLLQVYDNDDGMDIASMRGNAYTASGYAATSTAEKKKACESASFAEDALSRDFACNAIFYDTENDAIIDVSGRGVDDAKNKVLHPPTEDFKAWADSNGPRNFARAFKFAARGYEMTPELVKFMKDNWSFYKTDPGFSGGWSQGWSNVTYGEGKKAGGLTSGKKAAQWKNLESFLSKNFGDRPDIVSYVKDQYYFLKG